MPSAPLDGLRVVDLTDDSGRFATKLLVEAGASVVRVHDDGGVTHGPPMSDPSAAELPPSVVESLRSLGYVE